jgi:hypothetical protein
LHVIQQEAFFQACHGTFDHACGDFDDMKAFEAGIVQPTVPAEKWDMPKTVPKYPDQHAG